MIKALLGFIIPDQGEMRVLDLDVKHSALNIRARIGYMPDAFGTYDDLTVEEYLHFFAAAYRLDRRARQTTVGDVLQLTDLAGKREAAVDALSRGMKQRLGIARVLLHDPDFLLLDEPASGLDPRARIEMRELLKELRHMGKTILISSHILHELAQLCTRIGIIEAGRLVAEGSLEEIYRTLRLQRLVQVQLANPSDALLAGIRALPGVASAETTADRVAIRLEPEGLAVEDLLERILALGGRVQMFQPEAMDMETAFMKLTEGKVA